MSNLTGIVLTRNEEEHIVDCIQSLWFTDEVLVFDSYSDDRTVSLASANGARVIQHAFLNYASQRNAALHAVSDSTDWVLFVDADERVPVDLAAEILEVIQEPDYAGWRVPRHNYLFGKLTLWAGWYPDYQTRLLRVGKAHYDPQRQVHELVLLDGPEGTLKHPLVHYNYQDIEQFHRKQAQYSEYDARILYEQGVRPKLRNFILQPWRQFWWRFVALKGYRDGFHGLRLSVLLAWYEYKKYRLLQQMRSKGEPGG
ncbi:MAG: glycosyltransferase family 2 protein [Anaerolineae bacterium]|nr:glycosyltransferase family 2 protein [Anaerolineae bacterium]